jgi:hypothetical protein
MKIPCENCLTLPICRATAIDRHCFPMCKLLSKVCFKPPDYKFNKDMLDNLNQVFIYQFTNSNDTPPYIKCYYWV